MEKTIESEYIYKGKVVNLRIDEVRLQNNKKSKREIVEHRGATAIVPIDSENNIIMVTQYRKAVEKTLLEIPAGTLEDGEDPLECAKRELVEEIGFGAKEFLHLISFYSTPGFTTEKLHLYMAKNLYKKEGIPDEDEFIQVKKVPLDEAFNMVMKGEIEDAKSIIGILLVHKRVRE